MLSLGFSNPLCQYSFGSILVRANTRWGQYSLGLILVRVNTRWGQYSLGSILVRVNTRSGQYSLDPILVKLFQTRRKQVYLLSKQVYLRIPYFWTVFWNFAYQQTVQFWSRLYKRDMHGATGRSGGCHTGGISISWENRQRQHSKISKTASKHLRCNLQFNFTARVLVPISILPTCTSLWPECSFFHHIQYHSSISKWGLNAGYMFHVKKNLVICPPKWNERNYFEKQLWFVKF